MPRPIPLRRKQVHSEDFPIEQNEPIVGDVLIHPRNIVRADESLTRNSELLDEIAFNEEPVVIRLDPSTEANAATAIPIWVNGKGCEVYFKGRWFELPYIPVSVELTVKRKYLAVLIKAKQDKITTDFGKPGDETPMNRINRFTSAYQAFQVLEDRNPKGRAWLTEMRRRNY